MKCLRSGASQPEDDPQISQMREETPGLGRPIIGGISCRTPFGHDVGGLSQMINDDILAQNEIRGWSIVEGNTIFLRRSVSLIVAMLHPFLGKPSGVVFTEGSSLSFRLFDLRFDRCWLMDNRRVLSPEPRRRASALSG